MEQLYRFNAGIERNVYLPHAVSWIQTIYWCVLDDSTINTWFLIQTNI